MLILGSSGVIGTALTSLLLKEKRPFHTAARFQENLRVESKVIGYCLNTGSIVGLENYSSFLPRVAFFLAGISNPSRVFSSPEEAYSVNFFRTIQILNKLEELDFRTYFISSVEIFPGEKIDYQEHDEPRPLNLYGQLKLRTEEHILNRMTNCTIVRTAWNIASAKSPATMRDPVLQTYLSLTSDNPRMSVDTYFTPIPAEDFSEILVKLADSSAQDRVYHIAGEDFVSRAELADHLLTYSKNKQLKGYHKTFHHCLYPTTGETRGRLNGLASRKILGSVSHSYKDIQAALKIRVEVIDNYLRDSCLTSIQSR